MDQRMIERVDVAMLGSFSVWTRGTLQSRALPLATQLAATSELQFAIITTPWDAPETAGEQQNISGINIYNTVHVRPTATALAVYEQLQLLSALQPRIIHLMKPKAVGGLAAMAYRKKARSSRLIVDHDDWEGDGGWNDYAGYNVVARRLFSQQERHLVTTADAVTAASTLLAERARRWRRFEPDPAISVLPNGLTPDWIAQLNEARTQAVRSHPTLVLYSRFAEFSHGWLSSMLLSLDDQSTDQVKLHIIGAEESPGLPMPELRRIRPTWHGYLDRNLIAEILASSTIAIYPYGDNLITRSKQSVKLLELMAAGLAVVASDVGDVQRVARDSVVTASANDPASFARSIHSLIVDDAKAKQLGIRAQQRAHSFGIDRLADRLRTTYYQVLRS